jgi:hypothetical protein
MGLHSQEAAMPKREKDIEAPHDYKQRINKGEPFSAEGETDKVKAAVERLQRWIGIARDRGDDERK